MYIDSEILNVTKNRILSKIYVHDLLARFFYKDQRRTEVSEVAMDAGRLFDYGSRHLNRRSRLNGYPTRLMLSDRLGLPIRLLAHIFKKGYLKTRLSMFYHYISDTKWLFGGIQ